MKFIDSYKKLEKICSEKYGENHGLSLYIDEMINIPSGEAVVPGWDEDLKQLKHYRWMRNKIVHDPECNEADMCEKSDVKWLENFYSRILSEKDPLSVYQRKINSPNNDEGMSKKRKKKSGCLAFAIFILIAAAVAVWYRFFR